MYVLSNKARYCSYGESSWEDSDSEEFSSNACNSANSIDFKDIFKYYNLFFDGRKAICPFKNHKNGKENSGSFIFYEDTNTFYCFGCKVGSKPCDFVANIEDISTYAASHKILYLFSSESNVISLQPTENFNEKLKLLNDFSSEIRFFRTKFSDEKSFEYIEKMCETFDKLNQKHNLNLEALSYVISLIKLKINNF